MQTSGCSNDICKLGCAACDVRRLGLAACDICKLGFAACDICRLGFAACDICKLVLAACGICRLVFAAAGGPRTVWQAETLAQEWQHQHHVLPIINPHCAQKPASPIYIYVPVMHVASSYRLAHTWQFHDFAIFFTSCCVGHLLTPRMANTASCKEYSKVMKLPCMS